MQSIRQLTAALLLIAASTPGCGDEDPEQTGTGTVVFALRSTMDARVFELRNATFTLSGASALSLTTDDSPEALLLEQQLPSGDYEVELGSDWQLFEVDDTESTLVAAELLTENPTEFTIAAGATTAVLYRFSVESSEIAFSSGDLQLAIEVVPAQSGEVIFNEVMNDPAELADATGEWLELRNISDSVVDLQGCSISRDTTSLSITGTLPIDPGGVATVATSDAPGFSPDYVATALSLPNSGTFVLSLECAGVVMDTVSIDNASWPGGAGVSMSLSPSANSATANDSVTQWCASTTTYNTDSGSPGALNAECE